MSALILLICISIVVVQVGYDKKNGRLSLFDFKYIFEVYYIICLPLCNFAYDYWGLGYNDDRTAYLFVDFDRTRIGILILVGFVCFVLGHCLCYNISLKIRGGLLLRNWKENRIKPVLIFLVIAGYLSFLVLVMKGGGLHQFLRNIQSFRNTGLVGNGLWLYSCSDLLGMCFLIYMISRKKISTFPFFVMLLICVVPSVFLGFRGKALALLLESTAVYYVYIKKISLKRVLMIISVIGGLFVAYGLIRDRGIGTGSLSDFTIGETLVYSLFRVQGSEIFGVVLNQLDFTRDYQYGYKTLVEALTILIPHAIWPGKPTPKSVVFSETFFGLNGGVSPTILTELYWDFGIFGITLGMFFIGVLVSIIYNTILKLKTNSSKVLYGFLFYSIFLLAEAISGQLNGIVIMLFFYCFVMSLLTAKI